MDRLAALFLRYRTRADVDALGAVFDKSAGRLLQLAMHLCHNAADAEDVLQATFLLAMRKAHTFDGRQPLLPWLCGILVGEARNLVRRESHRQAEELPELVGAEIGPEAAAERSELVARLRANVETLPREQRQVLLLQLQHGLSPAEIGEVLEVPPGTVRMRIHRGLMALRKLVPAGLAAWLFGALPARGLAAVRQAVMREAAGHALAGATAVTAVIGGAIMIKQILAGAGALAAAVLLWWWASPGESAIPAGAGTAADASRTVRGEHEVAAGTATGVITGAHEREAAAETTGALRVQARSRDNGNAVVDVPIRVWPGEQEWVPGVAPLLARTDAGGVTVFTGLTPGSFRVVLPAGFDGDNQTVHVAAGAETACAIELATSTLRGRVVDENGAPVTDAAVRLGCLPGDGLPWGPLVGQPRDLWFRTAARSGSDGSFACECAEPEYHIAASHPDHASSYVQLTRGLHRFELVLQAKRTVVAGVVSDAEGNGVAGVQVTAKSAVRWTHRTADGTWLQVPLPEFTRSDGAGRFRFDTLMPGRTCLMAGGQGIGEAEQFVEAQPDAVTEVVLRTWPAVTVVGSVRRRDGTPMSGLQVTAKRTVDSPGSINFTQTLPDGGFHMANLPAQGFWITVTWGGPAPLFTRQFTAPLPATGRADFVMPDLPQLSGRVVDETGKGLVQWGVLAVDSEGHSDLAQASTDAEGRFRLMDLRAERVQLRTVWPDGDTREPAFASGDVSVFDQEVVLRVPADRMPRASVSGRLVDSSGVPLAKAIIRLRATAPVRHAATTDADGTFCVSAVRPGSYDLLVALRDQEPRNVMSLAVAQAEQRDLGDLVLQPQATLHIEVTSSDGTPFTGRLPDMDLKRPDGTRLEWTLRRVAGGFTGPVEPGPLQIGIQEPDLIAPVQPLELAPGETRRVRLPLTVGRSRTLIFVDGRQPVDVRDVLHLEVLDAAGKVVFRKDLRQSRHSDGNWTFERTFPFGSYEASARSDSDRRYRGRFEVGEALTDPKRVTVPTLR